MTKTLLATALLLSATSALAADTWPQSGGWPPKPGPYAGAQEKRVWRQREIRTGISHIGNMEKRDFRLRHGEAAYFDWLKYGKLPRGW